MIAADLQSISADLMTSKVSFVTLKVENLESKVKLSKSKTEIECAECTGDQVNTRLSLVNSILLSSYWTISYSLLIGQD